MWTVLLWVSVAWAGVTSPVLEVEVKIKAKVSQDLRTITGTIEADPHPGLQWVDLLSKMLIPTSDRIEQRTFTDLPEAGVVRLEPTPEADRPNSFIPCFSTIWRQWAGSGARHLRQRTVAPTPRDR